MKKKYVGMILVCILILNLFQGMVPLEATPNAEKQLIIHYYRPDKQYEEWNLWMWLDGKDGNVTEFSEQDEFGVKVVIPLEEAANKVGFIVRTNDWAKDVSDDRFVATTETTNEIWLVSGDETIYTEEPNLSGGLVMLPEQVTLNVHYNRYDKNYEDWKLWLWPEGKDGISYDFEKEDAYGKVATFTVKDIGAIRKLGFWLYKKDVQNKDVEIDRFISTTKADENGKIDIYLKQGEEKVGYSKEEMYVKPSVSWATMDTMESICLGVNVPFESKEDLIADFSVTKAGKKIAINKVELLDEMEGGLAKGAKLYLAETIDFNGTYEVTKDGYEAKIATAGEIFNTEAFNQLYYYEGDDLGANYQKERTAFKLWAPTASEVEVILYEAGNDGKVLQKLPMIKQEKGTWSATIEGNQNGVYYTYKICINGEWREVVDPYARTTGVNGMRAMVIDLAGTNPEGWETQKGPELKNPTDAIIYELHIRDLSTHENSGITHKGKFLGLTETETTTSTGVKTGLSHIKELGVTYVHLLPVFDYSSIDETKLEENDFNWGYDPQNYNVPEGSYATDPYHGEVRVKEFKEAIQTLHQNDVGVIMDVVYNHTAKSADSNLNLIVPDYYYRKNLDGSFSNGSGCGNEIASERAMVRKMIVESVVYWAKEYKIDGFRFDLMGLIDIDTMNEIRTELDKINPEILIYGEGWTASSSTLPTNKQALKVNASKLNGIAVFSDDFRDGIKGHVFESTAPGFANGGLGFEETIKFGIVGATKHPQVDYTQVNYSKAPFAKSPSQTVNYVSAHDNLTLWDKIELTNPEDGMEERLKIHKLSNAMVLTSQGVPFLHAGVEFVRTKGGNENSFSAGDEVNQLDWSRKIGFKDVYDYYKGLIELRKNHPAFRMTTAEEISKHLTFFDMPAEEMVGYKISGHANGDEWEEIVVLFNANKEEQKVALDREGWEVVVNNQVAGIEPIETITGNEVVVPSRSAMVLVKAKDTKASTDEQVDSQNETTKSQAKTLAYIAGGALVAAAAALGVRKKLKNKH